MSNFNAREYVKKKYNEDEEKTAQSNKNIGFARNYVTEKYRKQKADELGLDTLQSDLSSLGTTIQSVYDGWQTQEMMNNTKSSIQSMYNRLTSLQEYRKTYGITEGDDEINELVGAYKSTLDTWDELSDSYGRHKSADSYNQALKDLETAQENRKKKETDDLNVIQKQIQEWQSKYDAAKKEHDEWDIPVVGTLDEYNTERTGVITYYNNPEAQRLAEKARDETIKQKYGYSLDEFKKMIGEKEAYYNQTKYIQDGIKIKNDARNDGSYEEWSQEGATLSPDDFGERKIKGGGGHARPVSKIDNYRAAAVALYEHQNNETPEGYSKYSNIDKYRLMEEEEFKDFAYWLKYDKENGTTRAYDYIDSIEETLNIREGQSIGEQYKDKGALSKILFGAEAGLDQFASGISNAFNFTDDYIPTTSTQYASQIVRDDLWDAGPDLPEWLGGSSFGQVAYDAVNTSANMLPSIAAGGVSNLVVPGSGTYVTASLMGLSASGNAYQQMLNQGYNKTSSRTYATLVGLSEATLSAALSGMIGGKATEKAIENVIKGIDKGFFRFAVRWGMSGASEIPEEALQGILEPMFQNIALGYEKNKFEDTDWSQVAYEGLLGGISGLGLGGVTSAISTGVEQSNWRNAGQEIRNNERISDMLDIAKLSPQDSDAYAAYTRYAKKGINADNITDAQLGRLYDDAKTESLSVLKSKKSTSEQKVQALKTLGGLGTVQTENVDAKRLKRAKELTKGETTEISSTGSSAQIEGIKLSEDNTTLVTNEGEIAIDDITLSGTDAELVSSAEIIAETMGEDVANVFLSQYNAETNGNVSDYYNSFNLAMEYAKDNYTQETILENKGVLSESQVGAIYGATVKATYEAQERAKTEITEKHGKSMVIEGVFDDSVIDYNNSTTDGSKVNWNSLTYTQRSAIKFTKLFSKATGVNIKFIKSNVVKGKHKGKNGSYDPSTNTIEIDVYAGRIDAKTLNDSIIPTLSHELTHWMKYKSIAIYNSIREDVMKTLAEKSGLSTDELVAKEMQRIKENHSDKEVTPEDAIDELVARACEDMLSNSNEARKLLNKMSEKEQQSFIEKVKETFENLIQWVNDLLAHYKSNSEEAKILREYKFMLKKISKQWDAMLVDSIQTNQALQKEGITGEELANRVAQKNTTDKGDVKLSDKDYNYWLDKIETISDEDALKTRSEITYLNVADSTPNILQKYGALNLPLVIRFDAIYLAQRGSGAFEGHYHHLGKNVMGNLLDYVSNPDAILKTVTKNKNGDDVIKLVALVSIPIKSGEALASIEINTVKDIGEGDELYNLIVTFFDYKENYLRNLFVKYGAEIKYKKETLSKDNPKLHKWLGTIEESVSKGIIRNPNKNVKENTSKNSDRDTFTHIQEMARDTLEISDEDYAKFLSKKPINVSKEIKAKIGKQRISRYGDMTPEQIPIVDIFRVDDYNKVNVAYKYTIKNDGKDYFTVIRKQQIKPESIPYNLNKIIQEEIENARADKSISEARNGRNNNPLGNNVLGEREKLQENDNVVARSEKSNQERHNAQGISNIGRGVKHSDRDALESKHRELQNEYNSLNKEIEEIKNSEKYKYFVDALATLESGEELDNVIKEYGRWTHETGLYAKSKRMSEIIGEQKDIRAALNDESTFSMASDYSYESLVSKPNMEITQVDNFSLEKNSNSRKEIIDTAVENAKLIGRENENGNAVIYVNDIDTEIVLSKSGLRHGLDRRLELLTPVVLKTGEILKNAVRINELSTRDENISNSYVLIGVAKNNKNEPYIISFVINRFTNELNMVDVLYAINAKKEPAGLVDPSVAANIADYFTGSNISIYNLLDCVNKYFPYILPESVWRHYGYKIRPDGKLGESALFSMPIGNRKKTAGNSVVELSKDNELAKRIGDLRGAEKYKVIQQYILEVLSGEEIILSDGKVAVVDKSDAQHIARGAGDKKSAEISAIRELIGKAQLVAEEESTKERKFEYFCYYEVAVKYGGEIFNIYLNVGRASNDKSYHLYDITQNLRDTAHRLNGVGRPPKNEGGAVETVSPNNSITKNNDIVNSKEVAFSVPIGNRKKAARNGVVELSKDNELSKRISGLYSTQKYKQIQQYILEILSGEHIVLSDGKVAVVDKSDARHISQNAGSKKTAQISAIKELIKKARLIAEEESTKERKFDYFYYYQATVKYDGEIFNIYLNVGRASNDKSYHLYDITQKLRDTAHRISNVGWPTKNEGYILKNGISNNSITKNNDNVNSKEVAFSVPIGNRKNTTNVENSINNNILQLVKKVKSGVFKGNEKAFLNPPTYSVAQRIKELTNIDVSDFRVAIEARQIEHILKDHGENGTTDRSMSNDFDIAKIEYILSSPDSIIDSGTTKAYVTVVNGKNKPAKTILYEKHISDNSYYIVQAVPDTKAKTLYVVTAFIGRTGYKKEALQTNDAKSPIATPKSGNAKTSTDIISKSVDNVNKYSSTNTDIFNSIQELNVEEVRYIEKICTRLGRKVVFEDLREMVHKGEVISPDGYIEKGVIHLNLYAENPLGFVFKHELTHFAQNANGYLEFVKQVKRSRAYQEWLARKMGEEDVSIAEYKYKQTVVKAHSDIYSATDQKAQTEMIADFVGEMLFTENGSGMAALAIEADTKQRNAIVQFVLDFISYLKKKLNGQTDITFELSKLEDSFNRILSDVTYMERNDTHSYDNEVRFSIKQNFYKQLEHWDKETIGFSFVVGTTSDALLRAGIPYKQIRWDASKVKTLLNKHNGMSIEVIKQIPELLEYPIIVLDSKQNKNSRIIIGDLKDEHGKLVTVVLLLTPTSNKGNQLNVIKISSAQGRGHIESLFKNETGNLVKIWFTDKKRIQSWLNVNRLQLPLHSFNSDSNNIILPKGEKSQYENLTSKETLNDMQTERNGTYSYDNEVRFSFGITQNDIDEYVDAAYKKENVEDYKKYAVPTQKLIDDVSDEIDITDYSHALRDNDIRHIKNSHGEDTNEKYPVTSDDIKLIPWIVQNYDKVFVKTNSRGKLGLLYVKVAEENVIYYVEAVTEEYHNEKLLVNKQMIKTGINDIPNLYGLYDSINKKMSSSQYLADLLKIRKAYVQDVKENYPSGIITKNEVNVNNDDVTNSDNSEYEALKEKERGFIEAICKRLGRKVVFEDLRGMVHKGEIISPDGYIEKGVIHLNLYAKNPLGFVFKHELTHFAQNANGYLGFVKQVKRSRAYQEWLARKTGESDVNIAEYKYKQTVVNAHSDIYSATDQKAEAEMIADFVDEMLFTENGSGMAALAIEADTKQRNAIVQFVLDFISYLKKKLNGQTDITFELSKLEDSFNRILSDVTYMERNDTHSYDNEVRFSLRIKHTDGSIEEIADARNLTDEQAIEYLNMARHGELWGHSYIPIRKDTPQTIIDTLDAVDIKVENRSLVMQVRKAQQAMSVNKKGSNNKKHGSNIRKHAISAEQIVEIVNNLDNPTAVILQTNRYNQFGEELPDNVAVFVEYSNDGKEGVAIVEFDGYIDNEFIGTDFGDVNYHTVVTIFEPDTERYGMPFDYIEELLSNSDNYELEIIRRQPARSATQEKHPSTSSELPSDDIIYVDGEVVNNEGRQPARSAIGKKRPSTSSELPSDNIILQKGEKSQYENNEINEAISNDEVAFSMPIGNRKKAAGNSVVELSKDNELTKRIGDLRGAEKYKVIQQYILEVLGGEEIILSDGKVAVVDKSDALHIANKAANKKTAQISNIKEIVEKAILVADEESIKGRKFDYFYYYETSVKYDGEIFNVYLDVGRARNDGTFHIYDITNKIRDTANRINGLERPKPNEGYALTNGISNNSITKNNDNVNNDDVTNSDNSEYEALKEKERGFIEAICKRLGRKVVFEDLRGMVHNGEIISPDGYIEKGVIHLNLYAENPLGFVFKHELTHFAQNANGYFEFVKQVKRSRAYQEWLARKTGESDVNIAEYKYKQTVVKAHSDIYSVTDSKAQTEMIADFVGEMLFTENGSGMAALAIEADTKQRNAIVQFVLDFISYLKKKLSGQENITFELSKLEDSFNRLLSDASYMGENGTYGYDNEVRFSICRIVGENKTDYGVGVYLDSTKLVELNKEERINVVKNYIKNIAGIQFTAFDNQGNKVKIKIAPKIKYINEKGKPARVNRYLTNFLDNQVKQESLVLIDEIILTARLQGEENAEHPHGWLDNNGKNKWEVWKTYIQDKEKTIWEAKLKIANSTNGEKILYDVYPIEKVEQVGTMTTSTTEDNISQDVDKSQAKDLNSVLNNEVRFSFGITQNDIDEYVDAAYKKENVEDYKKYAVPTQKLIDDVSDEIDITDYSHALRDNDIRHIKNSHGEDTNEKYPVTSDDIKLIPWIVQNYDKVFVVKRENGRTGIIYVKVNEQGITYFLEQVTTIFGNEPLLINKQMIKTGIDYIPNLKGFADAINKKQSEAEFLADLKKVHEVYAQSVNQLHLNNSITKNNDNVNNDNVTNSDNSEYEALKEKERGFIEAICKRLGRKVVFEDLREMVHRGEIISPDGYIEKGVIHLNLYAKNPLGFVFKHELTHFAQNANGYFKFVKQVKRSRAYQEWLASKTGEEDVSIAEYKYKQTVVKAHSDIYSVTDSKAEAEMIADFVGEMLFTENGSGMAALAIEADTKQRNAIVQFVLDFISYLKKKLKSWKYTTLELSLLEDSLNRLLTEATQQQDGIYSYGDEISFCFVKCTNEELIERAETLRAQGMSTNEIFYECRVLIDAFGAPKCLLDTKHFRFYKNGDAKTAISCTTNRITKLRDGIEGKFEDFFVFKPLYELYPEIKEFIVTVRYSSFEKDTVQFVVDRYYNSTPKFIINKNLVDEYDVASKYDLKAEVLREIQRAIQYLNGEYIGMSLDYWKRKEKEEKTPYSKKLGRRLTAEETYKYMADNYEVSLAEQIAYWSEDKKWLKRVKRRKNVSDFGDIVILPDIDNDRLLVMDEKGDAVYADGIVDEMPPEKTPEEIEKEFFKKQVQAKREISKNIEGFLQFLTRLNMISKNDISERSKITAGRDNLVPDYIKSAKELEEYLNPEKIKELSELEISDVDSIERVLSEALQNLLGNTIWKDEFGRPLSLYALETRGKGGFAKSEIGLELRPLKALTKMYLDYNDNRGHHLKFTLREVFVNIKKPLVLDFAPADFSLVSMFDLVPKKIISERDFVSLTRLKSSVKPTKYNGFYSRKFREIIKAAGYDSIIYFDENADVKTPVVIVFDETQVVEVAKNGILQKNSGVTQAEFDLSSAEEKSLSINNSEKIAQYTKEKVHYKNTTDDELNEKIEAGSSDFMERNEVTIEDAEEAVIKSIRKNRNVELSGKDTLGRKREISGRGDTVFKSQQGDLNSFYISLLPRKSIKSIIINGMNFGTLDWAIERLLAKKEKSKYGYNENIFEAHIFATNPLVVKLNEWDTINVAKVALEKGIITAKYYNGLLHRKASYEKGFGRTCDITLKNKIELKGYDCIIFIGRFGKKTVMPFYENQIMLVAQNGLPISEGVASTDSDVLKLDTKTKINTKKIREELSELTDNRSKLQIITREVVRVKKKGSEISEVKTAGNSGILESGKINHRRTVEVVNKLQEYVNLPIAATDTVNRALSGYVRNTAKDSMLKNFSGQLLSVYLYEAYRNGKEYSRQFGTRLGTFESAKYYCDKIKERHPDITTGEYKEFYGIIKSPYVLLCDPGEFTPRFLADCLFAEGIISEMEYMGVISLGGADTTSNTSRSAQRMKSIFKRKGFDSIAFMNEYADPGSIGVIVFYESQLIPVAVNGIPIENSEETLAGSDESAFLLGEDIDDFEKATDDDDVLFVEDEIEKNVEESQLESIENTVGNGIIENKRERNKTF